MPKFRIEFNTNNKQFIQFLIGTIKSLIDNNAEIKIVKEEHQQQYILPKLDFIQNIPGITKDFCINYNGMTKCLSRSEFIEYCTRILKKFNVSGIIEKYRILKQCKIDDD